MLPARDNLLTVDMRYDVASCAWFRAHMICSVDLFRVASSPCTAISPIPAAIVPSASLRRVVLPLRSIVTPLDAHHFSNSSMSTVPSPSV